ncbi:MAG TPA: hypothetical protein VIF37_01170 [Methylobacter sp.]|jgi:hypothetical protein
MSEFIITVVLVVSLIAILTFLKKRKKCSSKETPKSEPRAPEQVKQQPETKAVANAETASVNPQITEATVATRSEPKPASTGPSIKPQAKEASVAPAADTANNLLPQDSILKRHYITHLCSMIDSLAPPHPTDSVLSRHYDAMLVTEIVRCLNDKKAMKQLIDDYENRR